MKINCFCATCQKDLDHGAVIDQNNELLLICPNGHFVKFPLMLPALLKARLAAHKVENAGRVLLDQKVEAAKVKAMADYMQALIEAGIAA